jgi:transcriptional regulator with XRE-family HTH domain
MLLPPDGPELTREAIEKRLQEIDALPDAGKLAQRLRKRRGLSQRSLGKAIGVMPRHIMAVEREGRVRLLRDPNLIGLCTSVVPVEAQDDTKLKKFLEILEPTPEERAILLQDVSGEIEFEKMTLVMELIGLEIEEYAETGCCVQSGFVDPWVLKPKPKTRNRKRQRVAAVSPMHAIGSGRVTQDIRGVASVCDAVSASNSSEEKAGSQEGPLRYRIQLVAVDDDGREETIEVAALSKKMSLPEHVGLTLVESKLLLRQVQRAIVEKQVEAYLATRQACERCNKKLRRKDDQAMVLRSLFGNVPLVGPRMKSCDCHPAPQATFQPLRDLLPENTTPELLFMESKWSSLVSYGLTPKVLKDLLPVDDKLNSQTVRNHTVAVAERCEKDLQNNQVDVNDAVEDVQVKSEKSDAPFNVGIDGAYLRLWRQRGRRFEILVGRSVPPIGPTKCFGTVHTIDDDSKRRLRSVLLGQGIQPQHQVRFMADGEDTLRGIQRDLVPDATHSLDWFHVTMRLTVLRQYIKGVVNQEKDSGKYVEGSVGHSLQKAWTSTKWKLWHGKIDDALERLSTLRQNVLLIPATYPRSEKFLNTVDDFQKYVVNNRDLIPNYGELWRAGLPITTASIESMVCSLIGRRFAKKQQMQWTPKGAHMLLQVRVKAANGDLPSTFQQWYPEFPVADHDARVVADCNSIAA